MPLTTPTFVHLQHRFALWLNAGCIRAVIGFAALLCGPAGAEPAASSNALYGDWRSDAPGQWRRITPADLPAPYASPPIAADAQIAPASTEFRPQAPDGFRVERFLEGLGGPRAIRVAPNGDVFIVEATAGAIRALRAASASGAGLARNEIYAGGLDKPSGLAFYPPGPNPEYLYVSTETQVLRFRYRDGDLRATTTPEIIVDDLPKGGHITRDIAFSRDGATLYVAVGSKTNVAEGLAEPSPAEREKLSGVGSLTGPDRDRATVLAFNPQGGDRRVVASGLRNCAALALKPASDDLWCAVNERDMLGDDLPPDYATSVKDGGFYGWPWFYIGAHRDPRHPTARADLAEKVITPGVLLPPHGAPVSIAFYDGAQFPAEFQGDAFVALHGSWNRSHRVGYKIVRLKFEHGAPTGRFQDFLTGFVLDETRIAGRPSGLAVLPDGSLLVGEDANGIIWKVSYDKK